jgi:hypothetical protein
MKCRWELLLALCLLSCLSFAGTGKKTHGEVADADSLLKVHTFCLDPNALTARQSADLEKFVGQASKPKGVFAKLHWQRVDNCSSADATVELTMNDSEELAPAGDGTTLQDPSGALKSETLSQAKMFITGRASGKTLYRVESGEIIDDRQGAFAGTFSKLLKDLKALSK